MLTETAHLSDHSLILVGDGKVPAKQSGRIAAHLETCPPCRERMVSLKKMLAAFARAHHELQT